MHPTTIKTIEQFSQVIKSTNRHKNYKRKWLPYDEQRDCRRQRTENVQGKYNYRLIEFGQSCHWQQPPVSTDDMFDIDMCVVHPHAIHWWLKAHRSAIDDTCHLKRKKYGRKKKTKRENGEHELGYGYGYIMQWKQILSLSMINRLNKLW